MHMDIKNLVQLDSYMILMLRRCILKNSLSITAGLLIKARHLCFMMCYLKKISIGQKWE